MSAAARNWVTEKLHVYTFEVGEGDFVTDMTTTAADEREARRHIRERLERCGLDKPMKLISVQWNVYKRTKSVGVAS